MALILKDRVKETTATTGTGTLTLGGAVTDYQAFSSIGDGNTTYYVIDSGSQWEVGIGTYSQSGNTLSRDTVLSSSNSNAAVSFSAGTKTVSCTLPAGVALSPRVGSGAARIALIGDSLLDNTYGKTQCDQTPNSVYVSGGIAYFKTTAAGAFTATAGMPMKIYCGGDPTLSAALNGANTFVLSNDTTNKITTCSATFAGQTMPDADYSAGYTLGTTTYLGAAITFTGTGTITVVSSANIPANSVISVDSEQMYVSAVSGTTLTISTRGMYGTAAVTHSNGAPVAAYTSWQIANTSIERDNGNVWAYLKAALRGRFYVTGNYCMGGSTTSLGVAWLPKIIKGSPFEYALIQYGTNDCKGANSAATATSYAASAIANLTTIVNTLLNQTSANIIIGTPPPVISSTSNGASSYSNYANMSIAQLRRGIILLAQGNPRVRVLDHYADFVDGSTGEPQTGYIAIGSNNDFVHPTTFGSMASSQRRYAAMVADPLFYGSEPITESVSLYDDAVNYPQGTAPTANIMPNGIFKGTTGGKTANAGSISGTVATGWSAIVDGGGSLACTSQYALTGTASNWGYGQRMAHTFSGANQQWTLMSPQYQSMLVGGYWYQGKVKVTALNDISAYPTALKAMSLQVYSAGAATTYNPQCDLGYQENGLPMSTGQSIWLVSAPIWFPSGFTPSYSFFQIFAYSQGTGSTSGLVDLLISNASMMRINTPY
jgi:hypothetical protein